MRETRARVGERRKQRVRKTVFSVRSDMLFSRLLAHRRVCISRDNSLTFIRAANKSADGMDDLSRRMQERRWRNNREIHIQ